MGNGNTPASARSDHSQTSTCTGHDFTTILNPFIRQWHIVRNLLKGCHEIHCATGSDKYIATFYVYRKRPRSVGYRSRSQRVV